MNLLNVQKKIKVIKRNAYGYKTLRTLETVFSSLLKSEYKTKSYTH